MSGVFLNVVNMSISASWIVIVILLLRLLLKKAPKWIAVLLWGIVAVRLICPFSIESVLSLIPSTETISKAPDANSPHFESGFAVIDDPINDYLSEHYFESAGESEGITTPPAHFEGAAKPAGYFMDVTTVLAIVWIVGMAMLLAYTAISYLRVKRKIGTAVRLRENIFQSENVVSPFVLGIVTPKVYLPFNIGGQDIDYVIAHECAHIRRKDHWWKPFGFLILAFHWFNPLMWLGYALLCRDIELACDEKVVKELDAAQKADYSQALLTCSVNRRVIAACPLAFGEVGVKNRVKSVLNYKKPAFWLIIVAILAGVAAAVCFLTDPVSSDSSDETEKLLAVLNNEKTFINESAESVFFKDHKAFGSVEAVPEKYALLDLDGEGTEELIVHIASDIGAYTVFNVYDGKVYGFDFWERAIIDLKTDGSFMQSSGAAENSFATLQFEKDHYVIVEQAYINDLANFYRVNGASATAEEASAFADTFHKKDAVQWKTCESNDTPANEKIITIQLIDEAQVGDYPTDAQYHDTKAPSQSWKIVVKAAKDVTDFRFVELDESEALTVGTTLFTQKTLKADSPVLLHTYINDATLNRGISYRDENGTVRYFGIAYSGRDGSLSLKELRFEDTDNYYLEKYAYPLYMHLSAGEGSHYFESADELTPKKCFIAFAGFVQTENLYDAEAAFWNAQKEMYVIPTDVIENVLEQYLGSPMTSKLRALETYNRATDSIITPIFSAFGGSCFPKLVSKEKQGDVLTLVVDFYDETYTERLWRDQYVIREKEDDYTVLSITAIQPKLETPTKEPVAVDQFDVTVLTNDTDVAIADHTILYNGKERGKGYYSYLGEWDGRYYFWGIENYDEDAFICSCDKEYKDFQKHPDITLENGIFLYDGVFYSWKGKWQDTEEPKGLYAYDLRTKQGRLLLNKGQADGAIHTIADGWIVFRHEASVKTWAYHIETGRTVTFSERIVYGTLANGVLYGFRSDRGNKLAKPYELVALDLESGEMTTVTAAQNPQTPLLMDINGDIWVKDMSYDGTTVLKKVADGNGETALPYNPGVSIIDGWWYYRYRPEISDKRSYLARLNLKTGEMEYCPNIDLTGLRFEVQPHYWGRE